MAISKNKKQITEVIINPEIIEKFGIIEIIEKVQWDVNYVSIRRKIQKYNFLKKNKESKEKKKINLPKIVIPKLNLWSKYCNWFNSKFNKERKENGK